MPLHDLSKLRRLAPWIVIAQGHLPSRTLNAQLLRIFTGFFINPNQHSLLNRFATQSGLLDHPNERKTHLNATPLTGGIAISLGIIALSIITPGTVQHFQWLLFSGLILLITGIADDFKDLPVNKRLFLQFIAASVAIFLGDIRIENLGNLLLMGDIHLGLWSIPLTYFALLAGINAVNLMDGIDGLAGTIVIIPLIFLAWLTAQQNLHNEFLLVTTLLGSVLAFLCVNFHFPWIKRAKSFLGDAGSTTLGFMLSCLFIHLSQGETALIKPVSILWLFAIPLIDTATVIILRKMRGDSAFKASRDHLHHVLLQRGLNVRQAVIFIGISAVLFSGIGMLGTAFTQAESALFIGFILFATYHFSCVRAIARLQSKPAKSYDFGLRLIERKLNKLEEVNQKFRQYEANKRNDAA